jgi:hypothetical protein
MRRRKAQARVHRLLRKIEEFLHLSVLSFGEIEIVLGAFLFVAEGLRPSGWEGL